MTEEIANRLLNDFSILPKKNTDPTFMEICQMGGDRLEERCSQILKFYFNPCAAHGLKGLFIDSLLELMQGTDYYSIKSAKVTTEEVTTDNKRIDIIVETDSFVMAIENKIGARLYNPLESYVQHINTKYKGKPHKFFIVLSVKNVTDVSELKRMHSCGYHYVNYQQLFTVIKKNLGNYILNCNQSYLFFLMDFIRTIENKYYNTHMEMNRFFFNNKLQIEELINEYNAFKESILNRQRENIAQIQMIVNQKTNAEWWKYEGWDLGISFNDHSNRIGIESSYRDETLDNPLGDFHIYITVWREECFYPYEEELKKKFPDSFCERTEDRIYLHLPVIKGNDHDFIANKLAEYYFYMKDLTDRIK